MSNGNRKDYNTKLLFNQEINDKDMLNITTYFNKFLQVFGYTEITKCGEQPATE